MTRTLLSLVLAFGLFMCISAVSGGTGAYADDFVKKYAGKYYNATNTTSTDDETATEEAPIADPACAKTLNKTNEAIAQFVETVGTAKDKWSLLGSIQRLGGQKYSLQFNCKPENLKFENVGEVGVNKTQDEACDKLIEIIQPLLNKTEDGASSDGGFGASLKSSQEALGISKKLGDKCKVALIDITQKVEEEEEETIEELAEEWEVLEEEDDEDDLVIQVVDDEGNLETIYPVPSNDDTDAESEVESIEEDLSEDEEEATSNKPGFLSFVQSKEKTNATKPDPWADVDYKTKYAGNYTAPPTLFAF